MILLCVRWYLAYTLSLRDLEEMMAERVEGRPLHCASLGRPLLAELLERFNRRKRVVGSKWHMDQTYIKVRGHGCISTALSTILGDTVEFFFSETVTWWRPNASSARR